MRVYKGYYVSYGYFGLIGNHYMLFANEQDYYDYADEYYEEVERECALENLLAQLPLTCQEMVYRSH